MYFYTKLYPKQITNISLQLPIPMLLPRVNKLLYRLQIVRNLDPVAPIRAFPRFDNPNIVIHIFNILHLILRKIIFFLQIFHIVPDFLVFVGEPRVFRVLRALFDVERHRDALEGVLPDRLVIRAQIVEQRLLVR